MKFTVLIEVNENSTWPNGSKSLLADFNYYKEKGFEDQIITVVWDALNAGHCVTILDIHKTS